MKRHSFLDNVQQHIMNQDPEVAEALSREWERQFYQIEMIASENFTSPAVMAAQGSLFTNKYAEGYPHFRYYGGCENVDIVEDLAIERLKRLFQCEYANVQPHSGSQANQAVYTALLKPGEKIMGMRLDMGGHLTHGSPVNLSGKWFEIVSYGVDENGRIDMQQVRDIALQERPRLIIAGGSAYPRLIDFKAFREVADEVGAYLMVDMAHFAGLVAGGVIPSPIPYAHVVTSTTHKTLRGPRGGIILSNEEAIAKKVNAAVFPGIQGGPLMHVIAAKAIAFKEALAPEFRAYSQQIVKNARSLAQSMLDNELSLISGGTDTHLLIVSLLGRNITGHQIQEALEAAGITANKNSIANDPLPPKQTSGVRFGTPPGTTRGFGEEDYKTLGKWIAEIIATCGTDALEVTQHKVLKGVRQLCERYPLYPQEEKISRDLRANML